MRFLYSFLFRLAGWKIDGIKPFEKKYIIIVVPHTSSIDFLIGVAVRSILKLDAKYLAKKELFKFPFGWFFRLMGGYPVDRTRHSNLVDAVVALFNSKDEFSIALAPEGTRKYVKEWKTGFYYIALNAHVPIVMVTFNYPTKTVIFKHPFYPSGNLDADMKLIAAFYKDKQGKVPKQFPEGFEKYL